ncbi:hypothetical protein B0H34DRAFT_99065 [Crassisporium funariophilum]|nr:hypothetical protein B0H34DRAFT_99065 [Crassisporium funariophilum]
MKDGFKGESVPMESDEDRTQAATSFVWSLQRGSYYVVASAIILEDENDMTKRPAVDAVYEIGVATSPVFDLIAVPMAPGIIGDPQVPPESCVYIPSRRYAPIKLEEGVPQFRLTQMKGTHELFGINVSRSAGFLDIRFEGMDALVQIYGPFDLNNDHLPHFDTDGEPIKGDTLAQLNSRLQIASSEGCCKRLGSGISSVVTAGRYIVLVFHCSIGHNEHRPYKVRYTFDATIKIRSLELDRMEVAEPGSGRAVNQLYRVSAKDGQPLVTQNGDIYKVNVATDDPRTQSQVRVVVFAYSSRDVLREPDEEPGQYVTYNSAFWGESTLTFDVVEDQVSLMFCRGLVADIG